MFENRRKKRNIWRKYAMFLGFNMRNSGIDSPENRYSTRKPVEIKRSSEVKASAAPYLLKRMKGYNDLPERSCLRAKPVRLLKRDDSGFRRRFSFIEALPVIVVIVILTAFARCLLGDCAPLDLVTREVLRPLTGGHL